MKIILTGGGTAGHVTPNIAIAPLLREEGFDIHYIGTKNGMEKELILNEGINYSSISAGKLRRYIDFKNITDLFKIGAGFIQANLHMMKIKPDVVFSKGGFVSCPVVWAAWLNRVPVVIHESDITPGLANKLSLPFANKICYAFPDTDKYLPKNKSTLTGIPVRDNMLSGNAEKGLTFCGFNKLKPVILIIGGSLGSQSVNKRVRDSLDELLKEYQVCHICGKGGLDKNLINIEGYKQFEYVSSELADLFKMSDLVLSRAGATTLYELLSLSKPNILIPLPKAVSRGDQILNAEFFKREGYSEILNEEEITTNKLLETINLVIKNKDKYITSMNSSDIKESSRVVVEVIKNIGKQR